MDRLKRYDLFVQSWGEGDEPAAGAGEMPSGEWVRASDALVLEEKAVRLEAELGSAKDCLSDVLMGDDGPMTAVQIRNAGDEAVAKHREESNK